MFLFYLLIIPSFGPQPIKYAKKYKIGSKNPLKSQKRMKDIAEMIILKYQKRKGASL